MNVNEIGCESVDWTQLVQANDQLQALVDTVMDPHLPKKGVEFHD
jgi:hypothetical protein